MTRSRVLGTCYVCGRKCFGYRIYPVGTVAREKGKAVVADVNGVRHGSCSFVRSTPRVTPSDA